MSDCEVPRVVGRGRGNGGFFELAHWHVTQLWTHQLTMFMIFRAHCTGVLANLLYLVR